MSFAIVAEFPLGFYRGREGAGQLDTVPSTARLHNALLAAAGAGVRADYNHDGNLKPASEYLVALQWLEKHPPDGIALPRRTSYSQGDSRRVAVAYRDLGLLRKRRAGVRRVAKSDTVSVAFDGHLMWVWEVKPPQEIASALDDLCPDVAYLGQSDSPVRLWTHVSEQVNTTHRRDPAPRISTSHYGDIEIAAPRSGRTQVLTATYDNQLATKLPSVSRDQANTSLEDEVVPPIVSQKLGLDRYVPITPQARSTESKAPWSQAWILPFTIKGEDPTAEIDQTEKVAFAVALHRTLISMFSGDAPSLLTGQYTDGVKRPANRLALQVINNSPLLATAARFEPGAPDTNDVIARQALVIAVPAGADIYDLQVIANAVNAVKHVHAHHKTIDIIPRLHSSPARSIDATKFWLPPTNGFRRFWNVLPAVVETRRQRGPWTLSDAVSLSVGLVWRDLLADPSLRGEQRYRQILASTHEQGVRVITAKQIHETHVERFVHKTPPDMMPLPYTAIIDIGDLTPEQTEFVAIGQSRHLGGGLLIPCDVPEIVADSWRLK